LPTFPQTDDALASLAVYHSNPNIIPGSPTLASLYQFYADLTQPAVPLLSRHSHKRLEARMDPHNRAAWAQGAHRGGARIHELYEAGLYQPPLVRDPRLVERQRQLMLRKVADPTERAALVRRLSKGAREGPEYVERTCVMCSKSFQALASRVRAGAGKTCSPPCTRARRAQLMREHQPARTAPEAWCQRTRLSARAQWRETARYQRIAAALSALDRSDLARISERDREMLEWYYGLGGEDAEALDYRQIADKLDRTVHQVSERIHRVTAQTLGPDVVHAPGDRNGTTRERCSICRRIATPTGRDASGPLDGAIQA
jgi:hypothetical protein